MGNKSTWYNTDVSSYANLTGLNNLPSNTNLTATASRTTSNGLETITLTLTNRSATNIAFFVRAEITAGLGGLEVLPAIYSDNYVTLWPGEMKTIIGSYDTSNLGGQTPFVRVRGYNVPAFSVSSSIPLPITMSIAVTGDNVTICWDSIPLKSYQLTFAAELAANQWANLGSPIPGSGAPICVLDPLQLSAPRYYRVRELP